MAARIDIAVEPACASLVNEDELRDLVIHALAAEGVAGPVALTVVLADDAAIHDLNRRFLDHDEPTDVISFAFDRADAAGSFITPGHDSNEPRQLGEIYVSCERAAAQSGEWGTTPAREVRFLVVHGVLHLLGWDDTTPEDRTRMLERQEEILAGGPVPARVSGGAP